MTLARLPIRPVQRHKASNAVVIQMSAPVQRATKALVTSAVNPKAMLNQNLHSPPYTSLDLNSDLKLNSNSDHLDSYLDLNTDLNTDIESDVGTNSDSSLDIKLDAELDADLDSKAEEILKDIAQLRQEGPVKLNHTPYTKKLWQREGEI
jgi:hypothetical protein